MAKSDKLMYKNKRIKLFLHIPAVCESKKSKPTGLCVKISLRTKNARAAHHAAVDVPFLYVYANTGVAMRTCPLMG